MSQVVQVSTLGPAVRWSPLNRTTTVGDGAAKFVPDSHVVRQCIEFAGAPPDDEMLFEKAGAREKIYFDPAKTKAAIVTCGGLCPGLNDVIRSVFLELRMNYRVPEILGIRYGYQGLNPNEGVPPVPLTMALVDDIHEEGGTILGSSRGNQDPAVMTDFLAAQGINILFCVGGDGTQRGAHQLHEEIARRGLKIAVVGIPKTIDNDLMHCDRSFGFNTAVQEAQRVLECAHMESKGTSYGVGLVKVMGRSSGFIAAAATLASQDVNFTLVPEVPFALHGEQGLLAALRRRLIERRHAVVVVAEGAGQDLFAKSKLKRDASGNVKFEDIGLLLRDEMAAFFAQQGPPVSIKYIDPSYIIRSVPANAEDSILCDQFARRAVHAAMAGKTDMLVGSMSSTFVHVPLALVASQKRQMRVEGELWASVLSATGQPRRFQ